jgi:hypothetical protein
MFLGRRIGQDWLGEASNGPTSGSRAIVAFGTAVGSHGSSTGANGTWFGGVNGTGRFGGWHPASIKARNRVSVRPGRMNGAYPRF